MIEFAGDAGAWLIALVAGFGIGWAARGDREEARKRERMLASLRRLAVGDDGTEDALRVAWRIYPRDPRRLLDSLGIAHDARIHTGRRK